MFPLKTGLHFTVKEKLIFSVSTRSALRFFLTMGNGFCQHTSVVSGYDSGPVHTNCKMLQLVSLVETYLVAIAFGSLVTKCAPSDSQAMTVVGHDNDEDLHLSELTGWMKQFTKGTRPFYQS